MKKLLISTVLLAGLLTATTSGAEALAKTYLPAGTGTHRLSPEHGSLPVNKYDVNLAHPEAAESCDNAGCW